MKKLIPFFLMLFLIASVGAEDFVVNPYDEVDLPTVTSNVSLDTNGLERTYLYCTWGINGIGETAIRMNGSVCPSEPIHFIFDEDVTYIVNIQAFGTTWNEAINDWQYDAGSPYPTGSLEMNFDVNEPPEPSEAFFSNVYDIILSTLQDLLCDLFPWFGFCSP